jgi:hypothetical protein
VDRQHGEEVFKRVEDYERVSTNHGQRLQTSLTSDQQPVEPVRRDLAGRCSQARREGGIEMD